MKRPVVLTVTAILAAAGLAACGDTGTEDPAADGALTVVTGAYPLEYAIGRVGGDHVQVSNLTQPGADPHDLELTPRQVGQIEDADLVVHLKDFQPALDDAIAARGQDGVLEVSEATHVGELPPPGEVVDDGHDHAGHGSEEAADDGHDHGGNDPHFWLDPTLLADTGDAIAERLAETDPGNADTYRSNAQALRADLTALDERYRAGLASCTSRDMVTAHEAFGYLANRYDLHQVGISGISTETEPSPRQLADLVAHVREAGVDTVYTEVLVSPDVAQTVAREAGVRTAVLDPLEGLTSENADEDYISIMNRNLATLRTGQGCS